MYLEPDNILLIITAIGILMSLLLLLIEEKCKARAWI